MTSQPFAESDLKIRKQWLVVLVLSSLLTLLNETMNGNLSISIDSYSWETQVDSYIGMILSVLLYYVLYHCAYKKPGTKLLTLFIVFARIIAISLVIGIVVEPKRIFNQYIWVAPSLLVSYALDIWWYFLTIKMRKINNRLKAQEVLSTPSA